MSEFIGMMKHVGVLNNTGKNVVVVFMRLPDDPYHALVIDTDALPDQYNESLRRIVESVEGQQSNDLGNVLGRRMSPDGSNVTLLQKFHQAGRLQKVPVSMVTMTPKRGAKWALTDVLKALDATKQDEILGFDDLDPETRAAVAADLRKFNVHESNMVGEAAADKKDEALGLLRQAQMLEDDAHNKRIKAYQMDPSLAPKSKVKKENPSKLEPLLPLDAPVKKTKTTRKTLDVPALPVPVKKTRTKKKANVQEN